jgi:hypothetical protein
VIEAENLWESYCRSFYLSSALRAREVSGQRVTLNYAAPIRTLDEALTVAVHRVDPDLRGRNGPWEPREEPDWPNAGHLRNCMSEIGASNLPKLDRALGLMPKALNDLRVARNYFAHKGKRTAVKLRDLPPGWIQQKKGRQGPVHPAEFLLSPATARKGFPAGDPVILQWLGVLFTTISLTVQPTANSP